jgi:ATP-dependent Clp protease ATP-binding subunit ClpA
MRVVIADDTLLVRRGSRRCCGAAASAGFDPQYGARPLRRAIQRLLEDEISERLLAGDIERGLTFKVAASEEGLREEVEPGTVAGRTE